ncbi:hypothetical protein CC79DRAFT_1393302 [Sarocladium strictum]
MESRQIESSDRSTTTTTLPPSHTTAILNPLAISQPSLLPHSTSSTSTSERSSYFIIILATSLWVWISQNRLAVLGAGVTFAGFVIGLAALVPAFAGQDLSQEALELARWTAMKDFIEQCWERKANGPVSDDCENAMAASLPPPPHMDFDKKMDKLVGRMSDAALTELRYEHAHIAERRNLGLIELSACIGIYIVLLLAWLCVQEAFRRLRWRSSLTVERRPWVSQNGLAFEEIREFSYDYVELRPELISPPTANRFDSGMPEERTHVRPPGFPLSVEPPHGANDAETYRPKAGLSRARAPLHSGRSAWPLSHEQRARITEQMRWSLERTTGTFSPDFASESPPPAKSESDANTHRREGVAEAAGDVIEAKQRLASRFEPKPDDVASMRRRQNMAAQQNRRASIVSDKSSGSVARVRRDEFATSSSSAFGGLEELEELSDEEEPYVTRPSDRGTGLWGEGYVNHPM